MIKFSKMVASGNDFVVIDAAGQRLPANLRGFAKKVCERKRDIGADGLLLLEPSKKANFKMRIFNPDGGEVSMCGNGARCAALYKCKTKSKKIKIETQAGILEAQIKNNRVKIKMSDPTDLKEGLDLHIEGVSHKAYFINTGVPHIVYFVDNLKDFNVKDKGAKIRYHRKFKPKGTNANFVKAKAKNKIEVRTYERGVEDETLACGTGSVASALIHGLRKGMKKGTVSVQTKSKEALRISFECKDKKFSDVYLEGSAKIVYNGRLKNV